MILTVEVLGGQRPAGETPGATGSWLQEPEIQTAGIGVVITCASIAAVIIAGGIVYNLTLKETFLIHAQNIQEVVKSPVGKVAAAGTGIGIAAAGIAALILIFLPKK